MFKFSLIYREGNNCSNKLANFKIDPNWFLCVGIVVWSFMFFILWYVSYIEK